jgi:hypothetical protein
LPDKPLIAVLPFQNMSGDPEQEYFADGLAQEAEAHAQLALRLSPGSELPTLRLQWRTSRCATMPKPCAGANLQSRFPGFIASLFRGENPVFTRRETWSTSWKASASRDFGVIDRHFRILTASAVGR